MGAREACARGDITFHNYFVWLTLSPLGCYNQENSHIRYSLYKGGHCSSFAEQPS